MRSISISKFDDELLIDFLTIWMSDVIKTEFTDLSHVWNRMQRTSIQMRNEIPRARKRCMNEFNKIVGGGGADDGDGVCSILWGTSKSLAPAKQWKKMNNLSINVGFYSAIETMRLSDGEYNKNEKKYKCSVCRLIGSMEVVRWMVLCMTEEKGSTVKEGNVRWSNVPRTHTSHSGVETKN